MLKPDDDLPGAPGSDDAIIAKYLGTKVLEGAVGRIVKIEDNEYSIVFAKQKVKLVKHWVGRYGKSLGLEIYLVKIQKNELDKYVWSLNGDEKVPEKVSRTNLPSANTTNSWLNKYYVFSDKLTDNLKAVLLTEECLVDNKQTPTVDPSLRVKKIEESQTAFTGKELTDKIKGTDITTLSTIVTDGKLEFTIDGTKIRIENNTDINDVKQKVSGNEYELIRV